MSDEGSDVTSILHLTVKSCFEGGLKKSAHEYATILYRDHKDRLDDTTKRSITQVIRRFDPTADSEVTEANSPCPYCQTMIPETRLECHSCKNNLPYCIATVGAVISTPLTPSRVGIWCSRIGVYVLTASFLLCFLNFSPSLKAPEHVRCVDSK